MDINDLKKGVAITYNGEPYVVIFSQHLKMGRGGGIKQTKLRNLINGAVIEKNFKGNDSFESADLERRKTQFLYADSEGANFMDQESFETLTIDGDSVADQVGYLKEGEIVTVLMFEGKPVSIDIPVKVELKVVSTPGASKGNTASGGAQKQAKLETGISVQVPMFINEGDVIRVNTETGEYVERAN